MMAEQFYKDDDHPTQRAKDRMWTAISKSTGPSRILFAVHDSRSFFAGMAAAFLLLRYHLHLLIGIFISPFTQPSS